MSRARTFRIPVSLTAICVACATGTQNQVGPAASAAPTLCAVPTSAIFVAVTTDVDSTTAQSYLATQPFGSCVLIATQRIDPKIARDMLDANVALITRSPAAIAYAATRTDLESKPLEWDRLYVLVVDESNSSPSQVSDGALDSLRAELARDVVRGDARASLLPTCGRAPDSLVVRRLTRIHYFAHDSTARSIAARLAALSDDSARIVGSSVEMLNINAPYVDVVPFPDGRICERNGRVIPLVETRARVITRVPQ